MKRFPFFRSAIPEKGVSKDDERASVQTDFPGFFVMFGRKFWNISNVNLLAAAYIVILALGVWFLSSYPVFFYIFLGLMALLFGPLCASLVYLTRGYVRGDPVYVISDCKYAFKQNFKQAILVGLADILIFAVLVFDVFYWSGMDFDRFAALTPGVFVESTQTENAGHPSPDAEAVQNEDIVAEAPQNVKNSFGQSVFFYGCLFLFLIYQFMRAYLYLLLVTFRLPIRKIFKNSFIFAFVGAGRNALALIGEIILLALNFLIFVNIPMVGIMLPLIITVAACMFMRTYAAYPIVKKYMITPYYKDEEVNEAYDKIFEDRG